MNAILKNALAVGLLTIATQAIAQVTFYEHEGFEGGSFSTDRSISNFKRFGFNDRASSAMVEQERWEVCEDARFRGRCVVLRPGQYPSLAAMGLNDRVSSVRAVSRNERINDYRYAPMPVAIHDNNEAAQITFYEHEGFSGRSFTAEEQIGNLQRYGFNDRASSVVVSRGQWEVCEDVRFGGRCVNLRPGRYPSLAAMGLNDRVSSMRAVSRNARVEDNRYAPAVTDNYRRRDNERLYDANVTSVRAVVGPPEQRCWVERGQVVQEHNDANIPGAIAGAVIGGILGHQIGGGSGKDLATVGGLVAGAAVGANVGRSGGQQVTTQDVQRCRSVPSQAKPDFWDVTYNFRGQEHQVQMTYDPGATVTVNQQGEPRE
ncbi:MAG: beta/gamma crystallin-related protein [Formivibrio sp.]|nr:beta/gamma crystallin-related protein [Formivibrio sp.]